MTLSCRLGSQDMPRELSSGKYILHGNRPADVFTMGTRESVQDVLTLFSGPPVTKASPHNKSILLSHLDYSMNRILGQLVLN